MGYILGLSGGYYHDSSACIIKDGLILGYSEEERWSRRKQNRDSRACSRSVLSCLEQANICADDIDHLAINWNPKFPAKVDAVEDTLLSGELLRGLDCRERLPKQLLVVDHHLSHAASSFYCSGFEEAAVLVVDGSGDGRSTTLWQASNDSGLRQFLEFDFRQSLGWFYETAVEYVGFSDWAAAGKFMGLSSYGRATHDFSEIFSVNDSGYELKYPFSGSSDEYTSLTYYRRLKSYLFEFFEKCGVPRASSRSIFNPSIGLWDSQTEFLQCHKDFAASVQLILQKSLASLVRVAIKSLGTTKICLAGGVALNCAANGFLADTFPEIDFFICPFANDSGGSVGAAFEVSRRVSSKFVPRRLEEAGIGPSFSDSIIESILKRSGLPYFSCEDYPRYVAESISSGKIIGWFHGGAEAGPRALGHRSILADPRFPSSRDRVNRDTKSRELWRPLCPSIAKEELALFSESRRADDFMLIAQRATPYAAERIPGVVHVDKTMRCHFVSADSNASYHALLRELHRTSGVPVVLNTSFNLRGEPIVGSPLDAVRAFVSTEIDILSIGRFIVCKPD